MLGVDTIAKEEAFLAGKNGVGAFDSGDNDTSTKVDSVARAPGNGISRDTMKSMGMQHFDDAGNPL